LTRRPRVVRELETLRLGATFSVVVCDARGWQTDGRRRHLVWLHQSDVLLALESPQQYQPGEQVSAEVASYSVAGRTVVGVVPLNSRTAPLDIPAWMAGSMAQLAVDNPRGEASEIADVIPLRFGRYRQAYLEGLDATFASADAQELVVRAAATASSHPRHPGLRGALVVWWTDQGEAHVVRADEPVDLAPLLGASLVLAALGDDDPVAAQLAVLLAHHLGLRCLRSMHVEPIAVNWLARPDRHVAPGIWRRLRTVPLGGELDKAGVEKLTRFADSVLARPVLAAAEPEICPVARGLLAALGTPRCNDGIVRDAAALEPLSALGRALTPPAGEAVACSSLLPEHRQRLDDAAATIIKGGIPLTLLPLLQPPSRQTAGLARRLTSPGL
jgi:hypothetical protein